MKFFRIVFAWLLFCTAAYAQVGQIPGWPPNQPVIASGYQGPIDINGAAYAFWSTRCGSTSYTGNVVDVWDSATGVTTETLVTCSSGGVLNTGSPSPLATTCASGCVAKTVYDQSGSGNCSGACNLTPGGGSALPTVTTSCLNGKICLVFSNAGNTCMSTPAVSATQTEPMTFTAVANHTVNATGVLLGTSVGGATTPQIGFTGSDQFFMFGNSELDIAATHAATHAVQAVFNGASSAGYVDGSPTSGTTGAASTIGLQPMDLGGLCFSRIDGNWFETGIWGSDKTANNAAMNTNQHTYWAF